MLGSFFKNRPLAESVIPARFFALLAFSDNTFVS